MSATEVTRDLLMDRNELRKVLPGGARVEDRVSSFFGLGSWCRENSVDVEAAFFVPGRIEVLGKHTDYAGGRSLLCAVGHGFSIAVARGSGRGITVVNTDTGESDVFDVAADTPTMPGRWSNYPRVVARRLARNFDADRGGTIAFSSNLPIAAGISSSSALVVSIYLSLAWLNGISGHPAFCDAINSVESLADYLGCVENGRDYPKLPGTSGVGTTGGSQDHTAILCSRPGQLRQFSFAPTRFEAMAEMPEDHVFVIASSGVAAEKTGAALHDYNLLGSLEHAAVRAWKRYTGVDARHLGDILSRASLEELEAAVNAYGSVDYPVEQVLARSRQFYAEAFEIIPGAVDCLQRGDVAGFGAFVARSQDGAEIGLKNQVPETIHLVRSALERGAAAASAFGAGFGGSVWAMVPRVEASSFREDWQRSYQSGHADVADRAAFFEEYPGSGAFQVGVDGPPGQILPV